MNNTSITFEQVLDQEKNELTEALILFGEGKRLNKALADLEMNRPEFYKFYEAGQQAKQAEIDELQKHIEDALEALLKSYKAQSGLPIQDEFNRGWVSAFTCVHNNLKNLIK